MAERIAVLGSNSFSGSHFTAYALRHGHEVVGISRSPEPHSAFLPYRVAGLDKHFTFVQADLNHHLDRIMEVLTDFKPPWVVNFAAQSMVAESWLYPTQWFQTNCVATVGLHERLRTLPFLTKYVHVSTPEVYGSTEGIVREDASLNPSTPYAVSRAAADMSLLAFHKAYSFPVVFSRAANVYGPGQQLYRLIPRAVLSILLGRKLPLHGGGWSRRSFIHIEDIARGTMRLLESAKPPSIYHFSTPVLHAIREVVQLVCVKMGVSFDDAVESTGERLGKDGLYGLDSTNAARDLGWEARIALEEGVDDVIRWAREHFEVLREQEMRYVHKP